MDGFAGLGSLDRGGAGQGMRAGWWREDEAETVQSARTAIATKGFYSGRFGVHRGLESSAPWPPVPFRRTNVVTCICMMSDLQQHVPTYGGALVQHELYSSGSGRAPKKRHTGLCNLTKARLSLTITPPFALHPSPKPPDPCARIHPAQPFLLGLVDA